MSVPVAAAKAAFVTLTDESTRKKLGWLLAAILAPVIVFLALLCSLGSGGAEHNNAVVFACFYGGGFSDDVPAEFQNHVAEMQEAFSLLDSVLDSVNSQAEDDGLDPIRVKAVFFALCFGEDVPSQRDAEKFVQCFYTTEERTRTVEVEQEDGTICTEEETYTVTVPLSLESAYNNLTALLGREISDEDRGNADSIDSLIRYGNADGASIFMGSDVPYIGADGFCSPIGENWRDVVTSEFGYRTDPFTGQTSGHGGIDLAVPTGTPVRAALSGTVTVSSYSQSSYGYYIMIDHGDGLATLYGHCSQLLVSVGQTVETGDVIALSGSTGRSTGPHLHFEVRVNGTRVDPRSYLP